MIRAISIIGSIWLWLFKCVYAIYTDKGLYFLYGIHKITKILASYLNDMSKYNNLDRNKHIWLMMMLPFSFQRKIHARHT